MKAWELLSDETKWSTGELFRDSDGAPCDLEEATRFCIMGACVKAYGIRGCNAAYDRVIELCQERYSTNPVRVNDDLGYETVLSVLKEADV